MVGEGTPSAGAAPAYSCPAETKNIFLPPSIEQPHAAAAGAPTTHTNSLFPLSIEHPLTAKTPKSPTETASSLPQSRTRGTLQPALGKSSSLIDASRPTSAARAFWPSFWSSTPNSCVPGYMRGCVSAWLVDNTVTESFIQQRGRSCATEPIQATSRNNLSQPHTLGCGCCGTYAPFNGIP